MVKNTTEQALISIVIAKVEDIFKNENKKIQLWDQDDVIDVYDKLQSVNQSVNSILKIDDSLGN